MERKLFIWIQGIQISPTSGYFHDMTFAITDWKTVAGQLTLLNPSCYSPSPANARIVLDLVCFPSEFLFEQDWEQDDHPVHSLTTQSILQGISQAIRSGGGDAGQRLPDTSSPVINNIKTDAA